ncbi:MAG: PEP-CTERM sorting domain-containing protein [Verrucomicrobiota bacterium]
MSNLDSASANVTETINGNVFQLSGTDLLTFLNARADANGFVTFLVENPESGGRGWGWATKEHADSSLHPTLSLSFTSDLAAIPEPSAMVALLGCLGLFAVAGRRRR